jgi:hypothetical protein
MLDGSDSEETEVIGRIQISYSGPGFGGQLLYLTGILHCGGIIQGSANRDAWGEVGWHYNPNMLHCPSRDVITYLPSILTAPLPIFNPSSPP